MVVEERVEPVAHGVLQRVLGLDARDRVDVFSHPVPQRQQTGAQARLERLEPLISVGRSSVDGCAARKYQHHRLQGAVGVELSAARHPAGVVGYHPADRAGRLARRIRAQLAAIAGEPAVDLPQGHAWLHADLIAAIQDLDAAEVATRVDEQAGTDGLAAQARAAGAKRQGSAVLGAGLHERRDLGRIGRGDHRPRREQIMRCVMGHAEPVDSPGTNAARHGQLDCFEQCGASRRQGRLSAAHGTDGARMSWRCVPRRSMPSSMTSPGCSQIGGVKPMPTPGGVPVLIRSPGSSTMNWLRYQTM